MSVTDFSNCLRLQYGMALLLTQGKRYIVGRKRQLFCPLTSFHSLMETCLFREIVNMMFAIDALFPVPFDALLPFFSPSPTPHLSLGDKAAYEE